MTALSDLRRLRPPRSLTRSDALRVAEAQARLLLELSGVSGPPTPASVLSALPIEVHSRASIPVSGSTHWNGRVWIIELDRTEPRPRQRFTLFHEVWHAIDHPTAGLAYRYQVTRSHRPAPETIADHFAACVLMPEPWVRKAIASGIVDLASLAVLFDVSVSAMRIRLGNLKSSPHPSIQKEAA